MSGRFTSIVTRFISSKVIKVVVRRFAKIFPAFLPMVILVFVVIFLVSDEVIYVYLSGSSKFIGVILAAFTTTLMMVGVLTVPIEKEYFGIKVIIIRNAVGLLIVLTVIVVIGIFFGEIFP